MTTSDNVYRTLKAKIEGGHLQEGEPCASESRLSKDFEIARGTVRSALLRLEKEGYLSSSQGKRRTIRKPSALGLQKLRLDTTSFGEFLRQLGESEGWTPIDDVLESPKRGDWTDLKGTPRLNAPRIAEKLNLDAGDEIHWFLRRRRGGRDSLPLVLQWTVVRADIVPKVDFRDLEPGGLTAVYGAAGVKRVFAEAHYYPTLATIEESRALGVERDAPLIEERRVSYYCPARNENRVNAGPNSKRKREEMEKIPYEYLVTLYTNRVSLDFSWPDN